MTAYRAYSPMNGRGHECTDSLCCSIFVVVMGLFAVLNAYALTEGNIDKLYHGMDYKGRICGVDEGVRDAPYLFWCMKEGHAGIPAISLKHPICVDACPGGDVAVTDAKSAAVSMKALLSKSQGEEPDCPAVTDAAVYKTIAVQDKFCLPYPVVYPTLARAIFGGRLDELRESAKLNASLVASSAPILMVSALIAVLLAFSYLSLLRSYAAESIVAAMLFMIFGCGAAGVYLYTHAGTLSIRLSQMSEENSAVGLVQKATDEEATMKFVAVALMLISALSTCIAGCCQHSIAVGAGCVEVACDLIFEMKSLLVLSFLQGLFKTALAFILAIGFLLLCSITEVNDGSDSEPPRTGHTEAQYWMMVFYVFASVWIVHFQRALYQFVVAYAAAQYYFAPHNAKSRAEEGWATIGNALNVGFFAHGGSLALGSALLACVFIAQRILDLMNFVAKMEHNAIARTISSCLQWVTACIHGLVAHLTKHAYIDIAISSHDFCTAATKAASMMISMGPAMMVLNGATLIFTVFGVLLSALGAAAFTYAFADASNPIAPTVAIGGIMALVCLSFMRVLDMTSDTLLYCYGLDLDSEDGTKHAPAKLKELVEKY